jgi:hypothetical protein
MPRKIFVVEQLVDDSDLQLIEKKASVGSNGEYCNLEITNLGPDALADFRIDVQNHPDAEPAPLAGKDDFVPDENGNLVPFIGTADAEPGDLAAGATCNVTCLRIGPAEALVFYAKAASAGTARVRIRGIVGGD